jgi:hypothetical protein
MADPKKPVPLRLRKVTDHYLKELVKTGAYGENKSDVMRRFIENGIRQALEAGVIGKTDIRDHGETPSDGDVGALTTGE